MSDLGEGLLVFQGVRILDANDAFCDIAGRTRQELTALPHVNELVAPEERPALAGRMDAYVAGQDVEDHFPATLLRPDGVRIRLELAVKSIHRAGRDSRFLVVARDVTERDRLEAEVRAQKLVLEAQSEASIDGILVVSGEGRIVFFNRRFVQLWGILPDAVAGAAEEATFDAMSELLRDPTAFMARVRQLDERPQEADREEIHLRDGRVFDRYTAPVTDEAGRHHGRVWFFRDVTEEHRQVQSSSVLAEASRLLAASLDHETIASRIATFIVPGLGDWCAVDVIGEDGHFHRIGAAHVDPARLAVLRELDRRYPLRANAGRLRGRVVATAEPIALFDLDDATLRAQARDDEHFDLLRQVGMRSAIWVPLSTRGRVLGVMSFGRASGERLYDKADLALGEELARRVALSLDNALAYKRLRDREQQQAVVAALGQVALETTDLAGLLSQAAERIALTLGVGYTKILEVRPGGGGFRLVAGVGWHPGLIGNAMVGAGRRSQAGFTLMTRTPVIVEDLRAETRFAIPALIAEHGIVSSVTVVIDGPAGPWGVLGVDSAVLRTFSADDVNFLQAVAHVITGAVQRRHDEAAVRLRDDRLELTLAASHTGTWEWDIESGRLEWSHQISRLHGLPAGVVPRDFDAYLDLIHPDDRELFRDAVGTSVRDATHFDLEYRIVWPDESVHWTNGVARVFHDEDGMPTRMVGIGRDITDRKLAEAERDRLLAQEREAHSLREAFIGVLSHELRTPITTIYGGVKLLSKAARASGAGGPAEMAPSETVPRDTALEETTPGDAHDASAPRDASAPESFAVRHGDLLADVEAESDRLLRLVEDLLVLSRVERGGLEAGDEPVQLGHLVRRAVAAEQARWPAIRFSTRIMRGIPVVRGDPTFVEQVLRNLLGNAAKYSPDGSRVRVVVTGETGEGIIRVLDEGPGVVREEVGELFQLFYRSARTARLASGAGIGLYVARRLVEAMGGRIWAAPRERGGSEFGFALQPYPTQDD